MPGMWTSCSSTRTGCGMRSHPTELDWALRSDREFDLPGSCCPPHRPVLVNDLQSDPVLSERYFPRAEMDPGARAPQLSVVAAELTLDGEAIGVINVEAPPDVRFEQSHLDFVEAVAGQISMAISHAALFDEDDFRNATDRLLVEATRRDGDMVMREVLDRILSALNSLTFVKPDAAEILFADPQDGQSLVVAYSTNSADIGVRVDIGTSVCGEAFHDGRTVLLQRAIESPDYRPINQAMRCEMAIPITFGGSNRFPIGVLNLESSRENAFSNVGQVLAERFARRVVNADRDDEDPRRHRQRTARSAHGPRRRPGAKRRPSDQQPRRLDPGDRDGPPRGPGFAQPARPRRPHVPAPDDLVQRGAHPGDPRRAAQADRHAAGECRRERAGASRPRGGPDSEVTSSW